LIGGKTDVIMMLNGAIAGLVAITAEPLTPSPLAAIFIGAIGGLAMYFSTKLLFKMKIDDVVGAIPAHLVAGVWGTLAVPLTNSDVSFGAQFLGTISVVIFVFIVSYVVFQAIKATVGLRISKEAEKLGTDKAEVGVIAYGIRD
jgi:Amt family ammonium transporter